MCVIATADDKLKRKNNWKANYKTKAKSYRTAQIKARPHLYTTVKATLIKVFKPCPAMIDRAASEKEWKLLKPKLVKLKRKLGVGCSVHTLAATLLSGGEDALSPALFQNMRSLLQIMLVIPASSAQSERDFSAQVRPSQCIAICGSHLQRSLPPPECAEQDQSQGAGGYVGEDAGSSHAGLHPCPHPLREGLGTARWSLSLDKTDCVADGQSRGPANGGLNELPGPG